MLPSVVAQRSIPTRHPVNTVYRSLHSLRAKKAGDMLSRCQLWYFPRHTPLGSSTMPGLADATDSAEWCARTRNSGGTTGNSCYKFISSKNAFGLDRTGLDWIRLDSTGSERPRDISEAGTFHLFFFSSVPWYDFTRISGESRSQHFFTFFSFLSRLTYSLLTVFQALAWVGAWVIGVLCAMESIGRSSADRYTFFFRQLVHFFGATKRHSFPHRTHTVTQYA
jgi:hypothetical protein